MNTEFEVAACHSDRAGRAHLSLTHASGAEIAIQNLPFDCDPAEGLEQEQQRILADAAAHARRVAEFLETQSREVRAWPIQQDRPGAAPHEEGQPELK